MIKSIYQAFRTVADEDRAIEATDKMGQAVLELERITLRRAGDIRFIKWALVVIAAALIGLFIRSFV